MPRASERLLALAVSGALLAGVGLAFRIEEAIALRVDAGVGAWLLALLPDLAAVLAFESLLLGAALALRGAHERVWRAGVIAAHALCYAWAVAAHQFFLHTGTRLDADLVVYAASNFQTLSGVLGSG